jgi:hypothetical protein
MNYRNAISSFMYVLFDDSGDVALQRGSMLELLRELAVPESGGSHSYSLA